MVISSAAFATISLLPNVLSKCGESDKCKAPDENISTSQALPAS